MGNSVSTQLVCEIYGGEPYEYYRLGDHVVMAPGVCGGRPTFKYTRLEVSMVLTLLKMGETIEQIVASYAASHITTEAIHEAIALTNEA